MTGEMATPWEKVMKFLETNFRLPGRAISGDSRHVQEMNSAQAPSLVPDVFTIAGELTSAHDRDPVRHFGWIPSSPDCSFDSGASAFVLSL